MVIVLMATVAGSYFVVTRLGAPSSPLAPETVAALLVANLVPAMALMVLLARRVAMRRAAQSEIGGRGRLHVRLVALFSVIAAVPTLLVVIFASLLFQSGLQFWFSEDAETILRNAENVAREYRDDHMARIEQDAAAMGTDIVREINAAGIESPVFDDWVLIQKIYRTLSEAAVISVTPSGVLRTHVAVDLDNRPMERRVSATALRQLRAGETLVATDTGDRVEAVIRLDPEAEVYLYISRYLNPEVLRQIDEAGRAASDYQETLNQLARPAIPVPRGASSGLAADRRDRHLDRAEARRPAGPAGRGAGRSGPPGRGRRPVRARSGHGRPGRGRNARKRLQPDDQQAREAARRPGRRKRPARQPAGLHRGGAVRSDRRGDVGRRRPGGQADQQLGRGAPQDRRQEPGRAELSSISPRSSTGCCRAASARTWCSSPSAASRGRSR